jgi:hypothetical protein
MAMPKTTMNKNGDLIWRQNDVGRSGERLSLQFKPKPQSMQQFSNCQFRRCVLGLDATHQGISAFDDAVVGHC